MEMNGDMILCRNCEHWDTENKPQWKGNCKKHPFWKDQWSQGASPNEDCKGKDFVDKLEKYKVAQEVKHG